MAMHHPSMDRLGANITEKRASSTRYNGRIQIRYDVRCKHRKGWGAVLYDEVGHHTYQAQGLWKNAYTSRDINTLEMKAVALGLTAFKSQLGLRPHDGLLLLVDNTSTRDVLRKGHVREYQFNSALWHTLKLLAVEDGKRPIRIGYTQKTTSLTDYPVKQPNTQQMRLKNFRPPLGRRLAESSLRVRVPGLGGKQ